MSTLISSKYSSTIRFVNELHPRCCCGICLHIADEPLYCGNKDGCTGVFCSKCLTASVSVCKQCPLCKFEITDSPQKHNFAKEIIYDEPVYCTNAELTNCIDNKKPANDDITSWSACQWTGPLKDLETHIAQDCEFATTPCSNQGCSVTPLRSQLPLHLSSECQLRELLCSYCGDPVVVMDMPAHLETCGKAALTCTNCQAPYLREDQRAHDACCPEKPVTCPFASHGCTVPLVRKDYEQHQIDSAVKHSELVAGKLSAVDKRMSDVTVEIASIKKAHTDFVASISPASVNVTWRIEDVSDELPVSAQVNSKDFTVRNTQGDSVLYLYCQFNPTGKVGLFLVKRFDKSSNKATMSIEGTEVTLQHPIDLTEHVHKNYGGKAMLSKSPGFPAWGWNDFIDDVKPYIAADDSMTFTCKVKYQVNNDSANEVIMV